jgi:DNA-binding IclR family transcriptional regulator
MAVPRGHMGSDYPVGALKIAADVVGLLAEEGPTGVTAVARALDLPKSTAHDHLRTLERVGYVVNEDGTYRLSTKLLHLGKIARDTHDLFVHGRGEALGLDRRTGDKQYVQLVTEEHGRGAVLLATRWQYERLPPQAAHTYPTRVHLHTNAPGKAILARLDPEGLAEIIADRGLPERTRATVTDEEALESELARIRQDGYAVDRGEVVSGMTGVAAPIVTDEGVVGAIAVYGSSDRMPDTFAGADLTRTVRESAETIEANLLFRRD